MTSRKVRFASIVLVVAGCVDTAPNSAASPGASAPEKVTSSQLETQPDPLDFTIVSIQDQKKGGSINPVRPPRYILRVVRAGLASEPESIDSAAVLATLRVLLSKLRSDAGSGSVTIHGITAFLYPSTAHANGSTLALGRAEWWPRGHSFGPDNESNISDPSTYETSLEVISIPAKADSVVERFTESERRAIYVELVKAQDRAMKESESRTGSDFAKEDQLRELYESRLRTKYRLTKKELDLIALEGAMEQWPLPTF